MEGEEQIHAGYEFESGMFARARSWTDLFPWVALVRVLRLLASPTAIAFVTVACLITRWTFLSFVEVHPAGFPEIGPNAFPQFVLSAVSHLFVANTWAAVTLVIVVLLLWSPVIGFVARQGAVLTAGGTLPEFGRTLSILKTRWWRCYLVPLVPIACVAMFSALLLVLRLPSMLIGLDAVSNATGWLLGVLVIPAGILGFGALIAVPLGTAALMNEADPDPIDSLSRGYEYLLRRPLHLFWYVLVCLTIGFAVRAVFSGVAVVSGMLVQGVASTIAADATTAQSAEFVVNALWNGAQVTLQLGLLGGVYLLLRRDAGGQHVEDLWHPKPEPVKSLPELPEKAYE